MSWNASVKLHTYILHVKTVLIKARSMTIFQHIQIQFNFRSGTHASHSFCSSHPYNIIFTLLSTSSQTPLR